MNMSMEQNCRIIHSNTQVHLYILQTRNIFQTFIQLHMNVTTDRASPLAPFPSVLTSPGDLPQVRMFPSESPVSTSPVRLNTKHWMNFGFLYFCRRETNKRCLNVPEKKRRTSVGSACGQRVRVLEWFLYPEDALFLGE